MKGLKKVTVVVLLAAMMSMGASQAWAGVVETPGHNVTVGADTSGQSADGTAESPGFFDLAIIFTATLIM
jgi:hypothetical protein